MKQKDQINVDTINKQLRYFYFTLRLFNMADIYILYFLC